MHAGHLGGVLIRALQPGVEGFRVVAPVPLEQTSPQSYLALRKRHRQPHHPLSLQAQVVRKVVQQVNARHGTAREEISRHPVGLHVRTVPVRSQRASQSPRHPVAMPCPSHRGVSVREVIGRSMVGEYVDKELAARLEPAGYLAMRRW